jgi:hypothetical protein
MRRSAERLRKLLWAALWGWLAVRIGMTVAPAAVPNTAITYAFLFLMGLGGALVLLSPITRIYRFRAR